MFSSIRLHTCITSSHSYHASPPNRRRLQSQFIFTPKACTRAFSFMSIPVICAPSQQPFFLRSLLLLFVRTLIRRKCWKRFRLRGLIFHASRILCWWSATSFSQVYTFSTLSRVASVASSRRYLAHPLKNRLCFRLTKILNPNLTRRLSRAASGASSRRYLAQSLEYRLCFRLTKIFNPNLNAKAYFQFLRKRRLGTGAQNNCSGSLALGAFYKNLVTIPVYNHSASTANFRKHPENALFHRLAVF